jgi:magnesium transporter
MNSKVESTVAFSPPSVDLARVDQLVAEITHHGPYEACELLAAESDAVIARVLTNENPVIADEILWVFEEERRAAILAAAAPEQREQWSKNHSYPEDSIGRLMDRPVAILKPEHTVADAIERLRPIVQKALVTYGWVVDDKGSLVGVLVFRDLLFAERHQTLSELMVPNPFALRPEVSVTDAM